MALHASDSRPLIAHIVFRFDVGGLENGVVNLVNGLPTGEFRHAIIALSHATEFAGRITRADVSVHEIRKRPGKDLGAYLRLLKLLRRLRPDIVHTRNYGTLDCSAVALLAGVPVRIHGEHGWDVHDPDGTNRTHRAIRRAMSSIVKRFVAVSRDLELWLVEKVGIPRRKVRRICNGVDTEKFRPSAYGLREELPHGPFPRNAIVVGSVTRFEEIKDPLNLVRAFLDARRITQGRQVDLRLLMLGDGPLRAKALAELEQAGEGHAAWLPGSCGDVSAWLRAMDIFVLGSRREGISNTVLEAMASGLPTIATATGGNLELVVPGVTGHLVPPEDSAQLAAAIVGYTADPNARAAHGRAARVRAEMEYSIKRMISEYRELYAAFHRPSARLA